MRTIVHLSDLHFGRIEPALIKPLISAVEQLEPHLVIVSGDLTQRARRWQFKAARTFLDELPNPKLVVPGNHDVPLYNVFARFLTPLHKYRRYISQDTEPVYVDDEIAALGVNSARSFTFADGRIDAQQVARVREALQELPEDLTKIVVCHHPFDLPPGLADGRPIKGARRAMKSLAEAGADFILSGHFHVSHTGHPVERYRADGQSLLLVHSGTATSNRRRGEVNAFNLLRVDRPQLEVARYWWNVETNSFVNVLTERYTRTHKGWTAE